ncbi:hypothetical protein NQ318_007778 [Aromia moschata]|uniref:SWIM-type domain-containing protein n=1 Tax=Aromia moschata TaxID=1265417 RepID=A0AAV8Z289_9CUCU|nr:hypothetical protein NQ318_007778 [Aromia moschata]
MKLYETWFPITKFIQLYLFYTKKGLEIGEITTVQTYMRLYLSRNYFESYAHARELNIQSHTANSPTRLVTLAHNRSSSHLLSYLPRDTSTYGNQQYRSIRRMADIRLSILKYMEYLDDTVNSKCVYEGEHILNAGHLILSGKTNVTTEFINIYALCLQTSALNSNPHEISGSLNISGSTVTVGRMLCSCKAGNSGKCKHISAVLIRCTRENLHDMEEISQTEKKMYMVDSKI